MSQYPQPFKPTNRPALKPAAAVAGVVLFVIWAAGIRGGFGTVGLVVSVGVVAVPFLVWLGRTLMSKPAEKPERGRRLLIESGRLRQLDCNADVVAEIDITRPFEYRILDRYDISDSLFRLYQGDITLTFYNSDPGGHEIVRDAVQLKWPPRSRHMGRSYPPTPS